MRRRKYIPGRNANVRSLKRNGVAVSEEPKEAKHDGSLVGQGLPRIEGGVLECKIFQG